MKFRLFITKILTDFRKTVETGVDPRLACRHLLYVKSWRAIVGDAMLEDFRGKDCAFVASWLRGKGLNKLCAVFEVFKF